MLPENLQEYYDEITDRIDGLIFPTNNGYENALLFDFANVQNKVMAYLKSLEFAQSVSLIQKVGIDVKVVELKPDSTEKIPHKPEDFVPKLPQNQNTLFVISAPGYVGLVYRDVSTGIDLFDVENQVKKVKEHSAAYQALVENRGLITRQLNTISELIEESNPDTNPSRDIPPLDHVNLEQLIKDFNIQWGELLPLKFSLEIKDGKAYATLSGKSILDTRSLPELKEFSDSFPVRYEANHLAACDHDRAVGLIVPGRPSGITKCGMFSVGTAIVVTAATAAFVSLQIGM